MPGSGGDPLITESPERESGLSAEGSRVLADSRDPETFSIVEVAKSAPEFLGEESGVGAQVPWSHCGRETEALSAGLGLHLLSREDGTADDVSGLREEPYPVEDRPSSGQSPLREQDGSAKALGCPEACDSQGLVAEAPLLEPPLAPSSLLWGPGAEQGQPVSGVDEGDPEEHSLEQDMLRGAGALCHLGPDPWQAVSKDNTGQRAETPIAEYDPGGSSGRLAPVAPALVASARQPWLEPPSQDAALMSSDEEDIYAHGLPSSSSEASVAELTAARSLQDLNQPGGDDAGLLTSDQVRALRPGDGLV